MQKIRITENDLHRIIKESVTRILSEIGDKADNPYDLYDAADGLDKKGYHDNAEKLRAKGQELHHKNGNNTFAKDTVNNFHRLGGNDWLRKFDHSPNPND